MIRLLIIDAFNLLRRLYSALPAERDSDTPSIEKFLHATELSCRHMLEQHSPSHAVCVFEHYTTTWRHQLYPPYKANRKPQPEAMLASFPQVHEILRELGIGKLEVEGFEADDVIASLVNITRRYDCQNLIVSTDHLLAQLLDEKTLLYDQFRKQLISADTIYKRYGIFPDQLADYFALVGSHSVNVPGVAGIGTKTAASLLKEYGQAEAVLDSDHLPERAGKLLEGAREAIYLYQALFRLRHDCPIHGNLKTWRVRPSEPSPAVASS